MLLPARNIRVAVATAAAAVAVTVGLTACGSDDKSDTAKASTTSSAAASSKSGHGDHGTDPAPTAAELQSNLVLLADPAKSTAEKAAAIVNGDKRTANIDQMNAALANYPLTFAVSDIKTEGAKATAQVVITGPHGPAPMPMTWEHVNGGWKLSDASACTFLGLARVPCTP